MICNRINKYKYNESELVYGSDGRVGWDGVIPQKWSNLLIIFALGDEREMYDYKL